jgi:hypothetical protein
MNTIKKSTRILDKAVEEMWKAVCGVEGSLKSSQIKTQEDYKKLYRLEESLSNALGKLATILQQSKLDVK